jgi:hypothetical protein
MIRRVIAGLAAVALLAACSDRGTTRAEAPETVGGGSTASTVAMAPTDPATTEAPPASTATSPSAAPPFLDECPPFVPAAPTGTIPPDGGSQAPLYRDGDTLTDYATAQPDYAFLRYEDVGSGFADTLLVGFVTDRAGLEAHRAAIVDQLDYPGSVSFCTARISIADLESLSAELDPILMSALPRGWGIDGQTVRVELRADQLDLAEELHARYASQLTITVGAKPYPDLSAAPAPFGCDALPAPSPGDLTARVELEQSEAVSGADFRGNVVVRNDGAAAFQGDTGVQILVVVDPGTGVVVGWYDGGVDMVGYGMSLAPAAEQTIEAVGGLASCDATLYAVPPGDYEVTAVVGLGSTVVIADPAPLRVTG